MEPQDGRETEHKNRQMQRPGQAHSLPLQPRHSLGTPLAGRPSPGQADHSAMPLNLQMGELGEPLSFECQPTADTALRQ